MRFLAAALAAGAALVPSALATWSIVAVDRRTGEVIIAGATCVSGIALEEYLPVIVVGKGGGAVQFFPDGNAVNRNAIRAVFEAGGTAQEAFQAIVNAGVPIGNHQYGICGISGAPLTYSGNQCWFAYTGRAEEEGDVAFAIQGNSMTCNMAVLEAVEVMRNTPGDLGTRVMAAMEMTASMGGDGRCSCDQFNPNSCGCTPPGAQTSALTGFLVWSRLGDLDGTCTPQAGCVNGDYFSKLSVNANSNLVAFLRADYDAWRAGLAGRPDHLNSRLLLTDQRLRANGTDETVVTLELVDIEGVPLVTGGASISIEAVVPSEDPVDLVGVLDHGDGTYDLTLRSNGQVARGQYAVTVEDGVRPVRLFPELFLETEAPGPLFLSRWEVRASQGGGQVEVHLDQSGGAGRLYRVLATTSGIQPGSVLGGVQVPLNPSRLLALTWAGNTSGFASGLVGALDSAGQASGVFDLHPAVASALAGTRVHVAAVLADQGAGVTVLGPRPFRVNP